MQRSQPTSQLSRTLIASAVAACFPLATLALPTAPVVVNGTASFSQSGNVLTVTNSNQAIINWQSFSIGANETTRFVQPSSSSTVLNRVITNDPSQLLGSLQSNGRVFLINPAGILVGQGAKVDVAGFMASTLNLSDSDFLANRQRFSETPGAGSVVNAGEIRTTSGGSVYLVAPQVENRGLITAPNGEVLLAAGQKIELIDTASPGVRVEITGSTGRATNVGTIAAEAGRIGIAGVLVENSGTLNANSLVSEGGRIFLKAQGETRVSGDSQISATGTTGGRIEVLGDQVSLRDNTRIDASGQHGGGTVLVGGDFQGKNATIQNAKMTETSAGTSIKADAIRDGNGGKIVVWSDDSTVARGNFSARGGAQGGDGGFVEASGKQHLAYRALTDTRAPLGKTGMLLLDPQDITLVAGAGTDTTGSSITVYGDNITANLATTNYTMYTSSGGTGNITFTAGNFNFTAAGTSNTLQLLAYGDASSLGNISIPAGTTIAMAPGATFKMVAGWDGASLSSPTTSPYVTGHGGISIVGSTTSISAPGGSLIMEAGGTLSSQPLVTLNAMNLTASSGNNMSMTSNNYIENVSLTSGGTISYNTSTTTTTHIDAQTTANGNISIVGDASSGKIGLGLINAGTGSVSISANKNILDDNGMGSANIIAGSATLSSANGAPSDTEIAISADINNSGGALSATAGGTYGGIRLQWLNTSTTPSSISLSDTSSSGGDLMYNTAGSLTTNATTNFSTASGAVILQANNNLTYGPTPLSLGAGQALNLAAGGNMTINNSINIANPIALTAGGTLTANAAVTSTGSTLSINAGTLNVTGGSMWGDTGLSVAAGTTNIGSVSLGSNSGDVNLITDTLNMNNGGISASSGSVNIFATNVTLNNSSSISAGTDLNVIALQDIRVNNGSYMSANNAVWLDLLSGSSMLYINETSSMATSSISTGSTINLFFAGRSMGGVVINGVETTTTGSGSGFFYTPLETPAVLGSDLLITYGNTDNLIANQLVSSLGTTSSSSTLGLADPISNQPPTGTSGGTGTSTGGGDSGSFGGTSSNGKPDEKNAKKKPPMCTP